MKHEINEINLELKNITKSSLTLRMKLKLVFVLVCIFLINYIK